MHLTTEIVYDWLNSHTLIEQSNIKIKINKQPGSVPYQPIKSDHTIGKLLIYSFSYWQTAYLHLKCLNHKEPSHKGKTVKQHSSKYTLIQQPLSTQSTVVKCNRAHY